MERWSEAIRTFESGELGATMLGRIDTDIYSSGASEIRNFIIADDGSIFRRTGTRYVASVKTPSGRTRLIPFIYSTAQAYILELGDLYMRFYRNEVQIEATDTAGVPLGVPYEIVTPYTEDELFDIRVTQSADVLYVVHEKHPPHKLMRRDTEPLENTDQTTWSMDEVQIQDGPYLRGQHGSDRHGGIFETISSLITGMSIMELEWNAATVPHIREGPSKLIIVTSIAHEDDLDPPFPKSAAQASSDTIERSWRAALSAGLPLRIPAASVLPPYLQAGGAFGPAAGSAELPGYPFFFSRRNHAQGVNPGKVMVQNADRRFTQFYADDRGQEYSRYGGALAGWVPTTSGDWEATYTITLIPTGDVWTEEQWAELFPGEPYPEFLELYSPALPNFGAHPLHERGELGGKGFLPTDIGRSFRFAGAVFPSPSFVSNKTYDSGHEWIWGVITGIDADQSTYTHPEIPFPEVTADTPGSFLVDWRPRRYADVEIKGPMGNQDIVGTTDGGTTTQDPSAFHTWEGFRLGAWYVDNYPRVATFYEQRLIMCGEPNTPSLLHASVSAQFEVFAPTGTVGGNSARYPTTAVYAGVDGPFFPAYDLVLADNGFTFDIATEKADIIRWAVRSHNALLLGSAAGVVIVGGGAAREPLTPRNIVVQESALPGCGDFEAFNAENSIFYIGRDGRELHRITFSIDSDAYGARDTTEYAQHILDVGVVEMDYASESDRLLLAVTGEGRLATMAIAPEGRL